MKPHSCLILDDDPHYARMLALILREKCPGLLVSHHAKPQVNDGYDIYVIDNDFNGEKCGAVLAEQVRRIYPKALALVLSGTLEKNLLKKLVNCHAAGVFDKSCPDELDDLCAAIDRFRLRPDTDKRAPTAPKGLSGTAQSIANLLAQWDAHLLPQPQFQPNTNTHPRTEDDNHPRTQPRTEEAKAYD